MAGGNYLRLLHSIYQHASQKGKHTPLINQINSGQRLSSNPPAKGHQGQGIQGQGGNRQFNSRYHP